MISFWVKLRTIFRPAHRPSSPDDQARALIQAIDAGGIPLNTARINHIARNLGLEVSRHASMEETVARIRGTLRR